MAKWLEKMINYGLNGISVIVLPMLANIGKNSLFTYILANRSDTSLASCVSTSDKFANTQNIFEDILIFKFIFHLS